MTISRRLLTRALAALGILAASAAAHTAMAQGSSQRPTTFTLGNGLQVVVIPDRRTPVVTQMIWYKVGSADETPANPGWRTFSNT